MKYLGDITEDATIRGSFNSRDSDGAPITLAGTPSLAVYKDAGTTEITAGVTLTVDFDSVTGLHLFTVDTSASADYATASDYRVVIAAGTVDSVSVVGVEVGSFSIQNRYMRGTNLAANQASVDTIDGIVDAILADTNELQTNQGNWLTATGFSTHDAAAVVTALGTGSTLTDLATQTSVDTINGIVDEILLDTDELQSNQGDWATATGFATSAQLPTDFDTLVITDGKIAGIAGTINTLDELDTALDSAHGDGSWEDAGGGGGGGTVNVLPAVGIVADRSAGVTLKPIVGETISQSITVYQSDGTTAYDLSGKTLVVIFETFSGTDVAVVSSGNITISGNDSNIVTFAYPSAVTATDRTLKVAIRDAAAPLTVYLQGVCSVINAPSVDA